MTSQRIQPHTLPNRSSRPSSRSLAKSVSVRTHGRQKRSSKLKDKNDRKTEHQCTTKCSSNKGFRGYFSVLPRIKFRVG
jgi:hypothetical protein